MNLKLLFVFTMLNVFCIIPLYSTDKISEQEVRKSMVLNRNYNAKDDCYPDVEQVILAFQSSTKNQHTKSIKQVDYEEKVNRVMNSGFVYDPEEDCYVKSVLISKSHAIEKQTMNNVPVNHILESDD